MDYLDAVPPAAVRASDGAPAPSRPQTAAPPSHGTPERIASLDGLRALAVAAVLLFHLSAAWLPGGFVGVDVFFVISGYVVTGSFLRGDGSLTSLYRFWLRRIARIWPALFATLVLTTLVYCLFIPDAWLDDTIARTGLAAFLGFGNVVLELNASDYFSPAATLNPFTHTWSLGVEEQFYLTLPLLLSVGGGVGSKRAPPGRGRVFAASIASIICFAALQAWRPEAAFYSSPARLWELGAGVLLRLSPSERSAARDRLSSSASAFGVILLATAMMSKSISSGPGVASGVAVVGTVLLITGVVADRPGVVQRCLAASPVTIIGRASYSIYLIHWPLIVLLRWTAGDADIRTKAYIALISIFLGLLSRRFVEVPLGRWLSSAERFRLQALLRGLLLLILSLAVVGAMLHFRHKISLSRTAHGTDWYPGRGDRHLGSAPNHVVDWSLQKVAGGRIAHWRIRGGSGGRRLFVIGDSHSLPYYPALRRLAEDDAVEGTVYFIRDCTFLRLDAPMTKQLGCRLSFYDMALRDVLARGRPGDVLFLPDLRLPRFVDQSGPVRGLFASVAPPSAAQRVERDLATAEAIRVLRPIASRGVRILFESPTPIFRSLPLRCSDWFNRSNPICEAGFSVSRKDMDVLRGPPLRQMRAIGRALPHVQVWDAFDVLCPGARCDAFRGDRPLFVDGDHLSNFGQAALYPSLRSVVCESYKLS